MVKGPSIILSEKDELLAEKFIEGGLKKNFARILILLSKKDELTSREIERGTDLRQPEVSIAINYLSKRKWARVSNLITENKGRPVKLYKLSMTLNEIIDEIETEKKEEFDYQMTLLKETRELIKEDKKNNSTA